MVEVFASFAREGDNHTEPSDSVGSQSSTIAEVFRGVAESCGVVSRLCPLLASEDSSVHLHTLRAIGNLCFDHGKCQSYYNQ